MKELDRYHLRARPLSQAEPASWCLRKFRIAASKRPPEFADACLSAGRIVASNLVIQRGKLSELLAQYPPQ